MDHNEAHVGELDVQCPAALRQVGQLCLPRLTRNFDYRPRQRKQENSTSLSSPATSAKLRALHRSFAACAGLVCTKLQTGMPAMPDRFNTQHWMSSLQVKHSIQPGVASADWFVGGWNTLGSKRSLVLADALEPARKLKRKSEVSMLHFTRTHATVSSNGK